MNRKPYEVPAVELPTLGLIFANYLFWSLLVLYGHHFNSVIWILLMGVMTTLSLSIMHEVVHGHPTQNKFINRMLLLIPIGWIFPYERFRDTHIEHHETGNLTDPFDDPESWYLTQDAWANTNKIWKNLLIFNNTLLGRILIGPVISLTRFYWSEIILMATNTKLRHYIARVWTFHVISVSLLVYCISVTSEVPLWQFAVAIYLGISLLLIRTFLEHQSAENQTERTVVIERCCPIAFLFLFNNLHIVHHAKPGVPWYRLPSFYRQNKNDFLTGDNHYMYSSYAEIFRKYFLRAKEPVCHPHSVYKR